MIIVRLIGIRTFGRRIRRTRRQFSMPTWECKVELAVLKRSAVSWLRKRVSWPGARLGAGPGADLLPKEWRVRRGRRGLRRRRRSHVRRKSYFLWSSRPHDGWIGWAGVDAGSSIRVSGAWYTGSGPIASSYGGAVVSDDQNVEFDRPATRPGMFLPRQLVDVCMRMNKYVVWPGSYQSCSHRQCGVGESRGEGRAGLKVSAPNV